ncbi:MAG: phosphate ABC transporter permease subunit PstC [Clostridiales bacterium]|nr:phosphate ABC transporter permease subunit PstC [Clostridiales bacterium]
MKSPFFEKRRGGRVGRPVSSRAADGLVKRLIVINGWVAIVILAAIFVFLALNSQRALGETGFLTMITGTQWFPTIDVPRFGFVPLIAGSALVTFTALFLSVPVSLAAAVYISEFAPGTVKEVAKAITEFMAAVPSVVYGFIGLAVVVPWVKETFELASGFSALSAGIVLAFMIAPTIVSISEDALHAVPDSLRQGSLALGNTRWQTTYKVVLPSASSGVLAAVMLGMGRAIGETMAVLMLTGNAAVIPGSVFDSVRTITGTIAAEMGNAVQGGLHQSALFNLGLVLFSMTFVINLIADLVLEKQRRRWQR